tara:strand:+ start:254 stop:2047 length:1794 start_codon:yes stop_codon:yes gene_type:complete
MAAIISEKFRIFNAKQFLESLGEGANDASADRTRMYFFVGRSAKWNGYLEIFNVSGTFAVNDVVYEGNDPNTATFKGTVEAVYPNSLLLNTILPTASATPSFGTSITNGTATAKTGVYRYANEEVPPIPLDNAEEKGEVYNEIIAAKRILSDNARLVVPRYNWNTQTNPKFDMYRPNYSPTPGGGGAIGTQTALGSSSLSGSKYYVMNSSYEVFKCIYNGQDPVNTAGQNATYEPKSQPSAGQGTFDSATGVYTEPAGTAGYIWKHIFTLPTGDVLAFLSTDFMPVVAKTEASRVAVEALAVDGAIHVAVVRDAGSNLPASATLYTPVKGDGTGAIVKFETNASGEVSSASMHAVGSGYTYGNLILSTTTVFTDSALTTNPGAFTGSAYIETVISPEGGHGSNVDVELFAKRVMTNVRLTYAEGQGDFPVDNDFRRIGIIQDPYEYGTTTYASDSTLRGTHALKLNGTGADYVVDELISQTVTGGTAKGTVVSWDSTNQILKYYQSPAVHTDGGVVLAFESNASNAVAGALTGASRNVVTTEGTSGTPSVVADVSFVEGLASAELEPNSGDIVYIENRRQITRAADQIEDIKLVIEF